MQETFLLGRHSELVQGYMGDYGWITLSIFGSLRGLRCKGGESTFHYVLVDEASQ